MLLSAKDSSVAAIPSVWGLMDAIFDVPKDDSHRAVTQPEPGRALVDVVQEDLWNGVVPQPNCYSYGSLA